jgi:hypothetical protein
VLIVTFFIFYLVINLISQFGTQDLYWGCGM